ncbi:hypothetical protein Fmac_008174 [Flemingia macrophylla]|uniref:Uncharacterized protein n=1 Tax=Flemingia macrophylla TaxID=520843 RepID=A0ABD1MWN0_9FABA
MISKIREYSNLKKGDRLKELQEKISLSESQLQSYDTRKQELSAELNKSKDLIRNQDQMKRNIDNLNYKKMKAEAGGISPVETELHKLIHQQERLLSEVNRCHGAMCVYQSNISKNKVDLKQAQYKDIDKRYFD